MFISQSAQLTTPNEERIQLDYSIDRKNIVNNKNEPISIRVQELYTSVSSHFN